MADFRYLSVGNRVEIEAMTEEAMDWVREAMIILPERWVDAPGGRFWIEEKFFDGFMTEAHQEGFRLRLN